MDIVALRNKIIDNPQSIELILDKLGFGHVVDSGKYYKFPNLGGDNMGACNIYKDTLVYKNYSHDESGNIFTLIMNVRECSFPEAIRWTLKTLGIKDSKIHIKYPFQGFFKKIKKASDVTNLDIKKYKPDILPPKDSLSEKFFLDGVAFNVQEKWGIRYDHENDSVLIPIKSANGYLVGCKARNNDPNCDMAHRWYAYLPYAKTKVLYGLAENYQHIIEKSTVIIFEAEKSVLQCCSFDLNVGVAIGGHDISIAQAQLIKSLMCKKIIVAFDEGVDEEEVIYNCKKLLVNNTLYKNRVYYIDTTTILEPGSKDSPSDHGKETFLKLLKNLKEVKNA